MKVLGFGTFDLLHVGHLFYLRKAKELAKEKAGLENAELIVIISRDSNVERFKGEPPVNNEDDRLELVKALRVVDNAFLGNKEIDYSPIASIKPDFIALGYDQKINEDKLNKVFEENCIRPKIIRVPAFKEGFHKTGKMKERIREEKE